MNVHYDSRTVVDCAKIAVKKKNRRPPKNGNSHVFATKITIKYLKFIDMVAFQSDFETFAVGMRFWGVSSHEKSMAQTLNSFLRFF